MTEDDNDDGGHVEQYSDYPSTMKSIPMWHPGAWAMPSTTLSVTSALVIVGVSYYLQRNDAVRQMFEVPWPEEYPGTAPTTIFFAALLLSALIAGVGSVRPGPIIPRLWVLLLAGGTLVGACLSVGGFLANDGLLHAVSVGCGLGTLTLAARLIRLRPKQAVLRWIAPMIAIILIAPVVVLASMIEDEAEDHHKEQVAEVIDALNVATAALAEIDKVSFQYGDIMEDVARFDGYRKNDIRQSAQESARRSREVYDRLDAAAFELRSLTQGDETVGLSACYAQALNSAIVLEDLARSEHGDSWSEHQSSPTREDLETAYANLVTAIEERMVPPGEEGGLPWITEYSQDRTRAALRFDKAEDEWELQTELSGVSVVLFDHHDVLLNYMQAAELSLDPNVDQESEFGTGMAEMQTLH